MALPSPFHFLLWRSPDTEDRHWFSAHSYTNRQTGREAPERDSLYPVPVLQKAFGQIWFHARKPAFLKIRWIQSPLSVPQNWYCQDFHKTALWMSYIPGEGKIWSVPDCSISSWFRTEPRPFPVRRWHNRLPCRHLQDI